MQFVTLQTVGGISGAQKLIEHVIQLLTKEYGNDGRRSLVCTQTMVISYVSSGLTQQICMDVDCFQDAGENQQELTVLMGTFARIQKIDAVVRGQRPVVMFTGSIDTGEWFLMKQAYQTLLSSNSLQCLHHNLVVVSCYIGFCIDGSKLMLGRSYFVMLGFCRNTHFPELFVDLSHVTADSLTQSSKIMVVKFLSLWRHSAEQGTAGIDQVFSLKIFFTVNQEIFLLSTDGGNHLMRGGVSEQAEET